MASVGDVLSLLSAEIQFSKAAAWDVSGLQLGDPDRPVSSLGVCHEVTEEVVGRAEGLDLLVTYHPLLFRPVNRLLAGRSPEGRAVRLLRNGVALAVAHTAFDAAPGGTADALAEMLELTELEGFGTLVPAESVKIVTFTPPDAVEAVASAMSVAGAGVIGNYTGCSFRSEGTGAFTPSTAASPAVGVVGEPNREPEVRLEMIAPRSRSDAVVAALVRAHPYEEPAYDVYEVQANMGFVGRVGRLRGGAARLGDLADAFAGTPGVRLSGGSDLRVERVAVVPGSGGSFVPAAEASGADVLVTGDVSHHTAVSALDRGLAVLDPGHATTERPGIARLRKLVGSAAGMTAVDLTVDPTPWL